MIPCPCCDGKGEIEERSPVPLSPLQFKIYDAVRRAKYGIDGSHLVSIVYNDRKDGGPDFAASSVRVTIHRINKKLQKVGRRISSNRRQGPLKLECVNA